MTDEKKTTSWDDLAELSDVGTKVVTLPATSKVMGRDVSVRIRSLAPLELVRAYNFPMDEVNRMIEESEPAEKWAAAMREHANAFGIEDLQKTIESTVRLGLVDPSPTDGDLKKLSRDFNFLFREITSMTVPQDEAADGAAFRTDG